MAKVYSYPAKVGFNEGVNAADAVTVTSTTDGCLVMLNGTYESGGKTVPVSVKDEALLLVLSNTDTSSSISVTVKGGNAWAGHRDLTVSVPKSGTVYLRLEGALYKNVSGDNSGYIVILPETASKITVASYNLA